MWIHFDDLCLPRNSSISCKLSDYIHKMTTFSYFLSIFLRLLYIYSSRLRRWGGVWHSEYLLEVNIYGRKGKQEWGWKGRSKIVISVLTWMFFGGNSYVVQRSSQFTANSMHVSSCLYFGSSLPIFHFCVSRPLTIQPGHLTEPMNSYLL